MGVTVLDSTETTQIVTSTLEMVDGLDYRLLMRDNQQIASESEGDLGVFGKWLLAIRDAGVDSGPVAHIGGGFCCLARMMGRSYSHVVYELEPKLSQFCPEWCKFIPGDWQKNISGSYAVIVYDLPGDVPRETLSKFLEPGGMILPAEV